MHVDFAPAGVAQDEVRGGVAANELESVAGERVAHRRDVVQLDDEVEVRVVARHLAKHRIDRPAAIERGRDADGS
jgi:hypothetical protein